MIVKSQEIATILNNSHRFGRKEKKCIKKNGWTAFSNTYGGTGT